MDKDKTCQSNNNLFTVPYNLPSNSFFENDTHGSVFRLCVSLLFDWGSLVTWNWTFLESEKSPNRWKTCQTVCYIFTARVRFRAMLDFSIHIVLVLWQAWHRMQQHTSSNFMWACFMVQTETTYRIEIIQSDRFSNTDNGWKVLSI